MTDQIPADKVREVRDLHRDAATMVSITDVEREIHRRVADAMEALLLTPPTLPTMADMSPEERATCRWMQADVKPGVRLVITAPDDDDVRAALLDEWGEVTYQYHANITPRPDLPRMTWPAGDRKIAPAPTLPGRWRFADHPDHGRVIVTKTTPDSDGRVYVVRPAAGPLGHACYFCTPDELTYLDTGQGADQ